MNRILAFLQNITVGPMERYERGFRARRDQSTPDIQQSLKNIRQCADAAEMLDRCSSLLKEITDLDWNQPIPFELRMAINEYFREIGKEDTLCP